MPDTVIEREHGTVELEATGHSGWCATADGAHVFTTAAGPRGAGATGAELLAAAAAVCAARHIVGFLSARGLSRRDITVRAEYDTEAGDRSPRVTALRLTVAVHARLTPQEREGVRDLVSQCTVVNTLSRPPKIVIDMSFQSRSEPAPAPATPVRQS